MRCVCCDVKLTSFDDPKYCKVCISASEDTTTNFVDPQHALITDDDFRKKNKPRKPY